MWYNIRLKILELPYFAEESSKYSKFMVYNWNILLKRNKNPVIIDTKNFKTIPFINNKWH